MRLRRRRDITASAAAAAAATEQSAARLSEARQRLAASRELARAERAAITASLRRMREKDNLAELILGTVEREAGNDTWTAGR